jgi:V/A-type H+-transporting ATPase subunit B
MTIICFLKETLKNHGALSRSIFFIHTASDPVVECLLVPDISLAVAEDFALKGPPRAGSA